MKNEIFTHQNEPRELEKLYRSDKASFKRAFKSLYPELKGKLLADFWNERLNFEPEETNLGTGKEILFVISVSIIAGIIAKFPAIFQINDEFFYQRNIGFIIFPALMAYFVWKNKLPTIKAGIIAGVILVGVVFINLLPQVEKSDTLILSCLHLLLFLWALLGFSFVGEKSHEIGKRLSYLKYSGDLVVMTTLILIAGGLMTGITIGLFSLIGFNIEEFYFQNIVIFGLPAAPIVGTYLIRTNPNLVGKVSPVIAKIFSPLVLLMLIIYLSAIFYSGKDPYNDREFLLIFNALLVGVMAIIFFSVSESFRTTKNKLEIWVLLLLSSATLLVNGIALSAILFRISEWGITPNRAAVLGGNVLILIHLLIVASRLYQVISNKAKPSEVGKAIAIFLPAYILWTILVTFLFPFIFGFK